jgi:rhodanese-related sulfurtransferase
MTKSASELVCEAQAQIESVEPRQAFEELSSRKAVALDVREPFEWEEHIEGALQVPRGVLAFAASPHPAAPRGPDRSGDGRE